MNLRFAFFISTVVALFSGCSGNDDELEGATKHIEGYVRWFGSGRAVSGAEVEASTVRMFSVYDIHGWSTSNEDGYYSITFDGYVPIFQVDVVNMDRNPLVRMESGGKEVANSFGDKDNLVKLDFYLQAFGTAEVNLNNTKQSSFSSGVLRSSKDSIFFWEKENYEPFFLKLKAEMEDSVQLSLYSGSKMVRRTSSRLELKNNGIGQVRFDL